MAQLALSLRVFIASPSDVRPERDIVEQEVAALRPEAALDNILLENFRWETDALPGVGAAQGLINPELEKSELIVGIFWSRLAVSGGCARNGFFSKNCAWPPIRS